MRTIFGAAIYDIKYYWTLTTEVDGIPVVISRTGWTGEVGYEVYLRDPSRGGDLWDRLMEAGQAPQDPPDRAVRGAPHRGRHLQLRLGHDDRRLTVPRHGPQRLVETQDADYIGKAALEEIRLGGVDRKLVGIEVEGRRAPVRAVAEVRRAVETAPSSGTVTDLIWSPRLEKNIGYVWVPIGLAGPGNALRSSRRTAASGRRGPPRPVHRPEEYRAARLSRPRRP